MCGIAGLIGAHAEDAPPFRLEALRPRGPDGEGVLDLDVGPAAGADLRVCLGQTRLAIVGGPGVPVPYDYRASCGVALAFNGEVYNWRELRAELHGLDGGTPWESECDAEVVARGFAVWGEGVLDRLEGMFAFCAVDVRRSRWLLARDRAGEKPLYYARGQGGLRFASTVRALGVPLKERRPPSPELSALEFDCLIDTAFEDVYQLLPGHCIAWSSASGQTERCWWRLPEGVNESMSWWEAVDGTEERLRAAIETRARLAPGVGGTVLVSGGLDSALVQAVVKAPRVYCVTFPEDGFGTLEQARWAAPGAEVVPVTFNREEAVAALPEVAEHLCTPATWSALGDWFVARAVAADGFKVVLSGEGADELFAGYARYRALWHLERAAEAAASEDPLLGEYGGYWDRLLEGAVVEALDRSPDGRGLAWCCKAVRAFGGSGSWVERLARTEWHTTMQVLLRMADRMTGAWGVENRSPFLDHRLAEWAAKIPLKWKIVGSKGGTPVPWGENKAVLRAVARRWGVDRRIIEEKHKRGLVVPWNRWHGVDGWNREHFAAAMTSAWRRAYGLEET